METFRLVDVKRNIGEDKMYTEVTNLTLINLVLRLVGPTNEKILTTYILGIQVFSAIFLFRYQRTLFFSPVRNPSKSHFLTG